MKLRKPVEEIQRAFLLWYYRITEEMMRTYKNFEQFWPYYVSQHLNKTNRQMHFVGTTLAFVCVVLALYQSVWFLAAVPLVGYGFAWFGHWWFEKNKPATFSHPLWSLRGDWQMYGLMWRRCMDNEVRYLFPPKRTPVERGKVINFPR